MADYNYDYDDYDSDDDWLYAEDGFNLAVSYIPQHPSPQHRIY